MKIRRGPLVFLAALFLVTVLGACSDSSDSTDSGDPDPVSPDDSGSADDPTETPVESGPTACDRLSSDTLSFVLGERFEAATSAATVSTCLYMREAVPGDSVNLSISTAVDTEAQLSTLESSDIFGGEQFRRLEVGDGGFVTMAEGRPRGGVFTGGELVEVVFVSTQDLGPGPPAIDRLATLLESLVA